MFSLIWIFFRLTAGYFFYDHRRGVLPDRTQRIGRGEVGAQLPLRLPSLPSETSHPPLSSRLARFGCDAGSYMA